MKHRFIRLRIGSFGLLLFAGMIPSQIFADNKDLIAKCSKPPILAEAHEFIAKNLHRKGHTINARMSAFKTSGTSASREQEAESFGSGFIISNNGYVLTCYHVIKDSQVIKVRFDDNLLSANVVYKDVNNDLALLKITGIFPALAFSSKPAAIMGQKVFTIGYPNPILHGVNEKLSRGSIISMTAVQEDIRLYQINVPIQHGNSGGPLLDMHGNVIGIVTAMFDGNAFKGLGGSLLADVNFAINSRYAQNLLNIYSELSYIQLPTYREEPFNMVVDRVKKSMVMIVAFNNPSDNSD